MNLSLKGSGSADEVKITRPSNAPEKTIAWPHDGHWGKMSYQCPVTGMDNQEKCPTNVLGGGMGSAGIDDA